MAIVTHGHPGGTTTRMYEDGDLRRLWEAGAFQVPEHLFRACCGDPDGLQILGVWQTREAWNRLWTESCRPIMVATGHDTSVTEYGVHSLAAVGQPAEH